jgi:hypothetical protein
MLCFLGVPVPDQSGEGTWIHHVTNRRLNLIFSLQRLEDCMVEASLSLLPSSMIESP